jgi:phage baseplate assembly protein W
MAEQRAISLPFSFNSAGEVAYTTDLKKIIQDRVVLAVMTSFDERVMRPTYGSYVHRAAFENETDAIANVENAVSGCFTTWFPYLTLISVNPTVTDNGLEFEVFYNMGGDSLIQDLNIKTDLLTRAGEIIREIPTNG